MRIQNPSQELLRQAVLSYPFTERGYVTLLAYGIPSRGHADLGHWLQRYDLAFKTFGVSPEVGQWLLKVENERCFPVEERVPASCSARADKPPSNGVHKLIHELSVKIEPVSEDRTLVSDERYSDEWKSFIRGKKGHYGVGACGLYRRPAAHADLEYLPEVGALALRLAENHEKFPKAKNWFEALARDFRAEIVPAKGKR